MSRLKSTFSSAAAAETNNRQQEVIKTIRGQRTMRPVSYKNLVQAPHCRRNIASCHSDIRMPMWYTHIGLDDQAKAAATIPALISLSLRSRFPPPLRKGTLAFTSVETTSDR